MKSIRWTSTLLASVGAALALSAGLASSAWAVPQWYVGGKKLTKYHNITTGKLAEAVKVEENIVISVPSEKLSITCKEAKIAGESRIQGINYMQLEFLSFKGCQTTEPATGCELEERWNTGTGLEGAAATEGTSPEDKLLIAPKVNEDLMEFVWAEGDKCEQANKALQAFLAGQITLSLLKGREEAVEQTVAGEGTSESPNELTFVEHPAYLKGKLKIKLSSGSKWSFH